MQTITPFPAETDRRQKYLGKYLTDSGYQVILAETDPILEITAAELKKNNEKTLVLLPIPAPSSLLSRLKESISSRHIVLGGNLPEGFTDFCKQNQISYIDYFQSPSLAIENAVATAEGAICQAIEMTDINLHQSQVLVIGFGKCGEILADKLCGLKCNVTVSTRDPIAKARAKAHGFGLLKDPLSYPSFDILFNTAPAPVITPDVIDRLKEDAVILDIASSPGGTDFNYCAEKGILAKHCPGIPGKYSPKSSAKILFGQIQEKLKHIVKDTEPNT